MRTAFPQCSKKVLLLNILDILRRYTDADHRLSQREIVDILRREYNMTVDRKAVKRNLMDLVDLGYEVEYTETARVTPDPKTGRPEENRILSDFYLSREFTDGERGCSSTALSSPGTSPTPNVRSWWRSWRACPTSISAPGCGTSAGCRRTGRTTSRSF